MPNKFHEDWKKSPELDIFGEGDENYVNGLAR
jgi:hypothetical protein